MPGQLSFFSAGAMPPALSDLEGLLLGPGQAVRRDGGARVTVVVEEPWRVAALLAELAGLGIEGEAVPSPLQPGATSVRTPFLPGLDPLVGSWESGEGKRAPQRLRLDGPRLRWWFLAAGRAYFGPQPCWQLGLGEHDEAVWAPAGAALHAVGLPAAFVGPRGDGPAYRIAGAKRVRRLLELIGERPESVPIEAWPDELGE